MVNSAIDNFTCLMTIRKNVGEPKTYGKNLTVAPVWQADRPTDEHGGHSEVTITVTGNTILKK